MASLAFAYEGALDYETLKRYPNREIEVLTDVMNEINDAKSAAIEKSRGKGQTMNNPNRIGSFSGQS